jgi:hypothetical protein
MNMKVLIVALDAAVPVEVPDAEVHVVASALNSRLRHWFSDDGGARRTAEERLASYLERLACTGAHARGSVGDSDPVQAIADALATFAADEIVIAAHPKRSCPCAAEIACRARERFALPVVDTEAFSNAA